MRSTALDFDYEDRRFRYNLTSEINITSPVRAIEVRHVLFDLFGEHMKNLKNLEAKDLAAGGHSLSGQWNVLRENDLSEHLTTVTFISKVRLADGSVWPPLT